jgi:hypothetical protein
MNPHDRKRFIKLLNLLRQAQEQASICELYLVANKRDPEQANDIVIAQEHLDIIIKRLEERVNP